MDLAAILRRDVTAAVLAGVLVLPSRSYEVPVVTRLPAVAEQSPAAVFRPTVIDTATRPSVVLPSFAAASPSVSSVISSVVAYTLPAFAMQVPSYTTTPVRYEPAREDYVHVPSWVTVSRAPFSSFGSSLFGLAVPSTGSVYVREDLQGKEFTEVLFHEVLHTLYPACSESQIRSMVLARFGSNAPIHTHVCRPGQC